MSANPAKAMPMTGWYDAMLVGRLRRNGIAGGTAAGPVAAALFRIGEFFRAIRGRRPELPPGSGGPSLRSGHAMTIPGMIRRSGR
jgi:hypothetical protein